MAGSTYRGLIKTKQKICDQIVRKSCTDVVAHRIGVLRGSRNGGVMGCVKRDEVVNKLKLLRKKSKYI